MKSEKEKADEILKASDDARKGIKHQDKDNRDPLSVEEKERKKAGKLAGVAIGAGLKRSG
jgi:hypothetical protein